MKRSKRILSLILVCVTLMGLFSGCGKKEATADGPRVLTVGIPQDANIPDYNTNAFTTYLEEITGIDIQFVYFASASANYKQQLTLMCTGGETLPDVLVGFTGMSHYVVNQFGEDGFIIDLKDLIKEKAPNYQEALTKIDKNLKQYVEEKGTNTVTDAFYSMPLVSLQTIDNMQSLICINKTWLDTLGLQAPTNISELYAVAQAFATQDPNGNGEADEMALTTSDEVYNWLLNAFVEYHSGNFNVKDGKVWDPVVSDEFRQGLIYVNKLVEEGLYNELSFTLSKSELKNLISPVDGPSKVGIFGGHHETLTNASTDALDHFVALAPLADETGKGGFTVVNPAQVYWAAYITKDCKNPELAMEFLDAFYLDETVSRMRHGAKDVDWYEEEGQNFQGSTSYVNIINSQAFFDSSLNCTWGNVLGVLTEENYLPVATEGTGRIAQASRLNAEQYALLKGGKQREGELSNLVYTPEEYEKRELKQGNIYAYITENIVLFMTGEKNPNDDAAWNEYKSTLKSLGREDMMKIAQDAYDRKQAK